jgi:hypothetical protein
MLTPSAIDGATVQFVIGREGKPTGVLLDIATWLRILEALEDAEDIIATKQVLATLDQAGGDPFKAGFLDWDEIRHELISRATEE